MSFLSDLVDVVEHLVHTHPTFNLSLSKDEALAKLAVTRANLLAHDIAHAPVAAVENPVETLQKVEAALEPLTELLDPFAPAAPAVAVPPVV